VRGDAWPMLLEALNHHRGKGQQNMKAEHVHVHSGGQAVVGMVGTSDAGDHAKIEGQPHAAQIAYAAQPERRCTAGRLDGRANRGSWEYVM
jgi:hypothetical protein